MTQPRKFIRDGNTAYIVPGTARGQHPGNEHPVCAVWNHGRSFCGFQRADEAAAWLISEGYAPTPFGA